MEPVSDSCNDSLADSRVRSTLASRRFCARAVVPSVAINRDKPSRSRAIKDGVCSKVSAASPGCRSWRMGEGVLIVTIWADHPVVDWRNHVPDVAIQTCAGAGRQDRPARAVATVRKPASARRPWPLPVVVAGLGAAPVPVPVPVPVPWARWAAIARPAGGFPAASDLAGPDPVGALKDPFGSDPEAFDR